MFGSGVSTSVLTYISNHGGGTVAVESQQGASQTIIDGGTNVVAIGGFSGRESTVSIAWLADRVAAGKIRWVITTSTGTTASTGGGGLPGDARQGSAAALSAAAKIGTKVTVGTTTLYDLQGKAAALRAQA